MQFPSIQPATSTALLFCYGSRLPIRMETCDSLSSTPPSSSDPGPLHWCPEKGKQGAPTCSQVPCTPCRSFNATATQEEQGDAAWKAYHRIMEWLGLEGNLKIIQFQPPCHWLLAPTRSGCPGPHPWPWVPPEMGHPQILWAAVPVLGGSDGEPSAVTLMSHW